MKRARLTEPGITNWIETLLHQYRTERHRTENAWFNVGMFVLLIVVTAGVLISRFKDKRNPHKQRQKLRDKRKYIDKQMRGLAAISAKEGRITGLPAFDEASWR